MFKQPANVTFGETAITSIRKHIHQVRWRKGAKEDIPDIGKGGLEAVKRIIVERVANGGGHETTYAGVAAFAFEDGGVTYIVKRNGEFWTILSNK